MLDPARDTVDEIASGPCGVCPRRPFQSEDAPARRGSRVPAVPPARRKRWDQRLTAPRLSKAQFQGAFAAQQARAHARSTCYHENLLPNLLKAI